MAKVSIKTATEPVASGASAPGAPVVTTDALGRTIKVKKPTALQRLRVIDAIGSASAQNQMYLGQIMLACSVAAIDDEAIPFPRTKREMEALVERLGDEGIEAAANGLVEIMGLVIDPETGAPVREGELADRAKN